jgi:hypothetical protein
MGKRLYQAACKACGIQEKQSLCLRQMCKRLSDTRGHYLRFNYMQVFSYQQSVNGVAIG